MAFSQQDILEDIVECQSFNRPPPEVIMAVWTEYKLKANRERQEKWKARPGNWTKVILYMKAYNQRPSTKERNRAREKARRARMRLLNPGKTNSHKRVVKLSSAGIDPAKVVAIRELHSKGGLTYRAIGVMYGIALQTVFDIVKRKKWKHVS